MLKCREIGIVDNAAVAVAVGSNCRTARKPGLTMKVYARTRIDRLSSLVEHIGNEVLPETECALYVHQDDDESNESPAILLNDNFLHVVEDGGGGGIRSCCPAIT